MDQCWITASSCGAGNNVIGLAKNGVKCQYFGIGMIEYAFAEFRTGKKGLEDLVECKSPFSSRTEWKFNPIDAPLPRD
jgi:hypothetical protein